MLDDRYSLLFLQDRATAPTPKARSFELTGDRVQYAPDRPADVKHVKLVITLDFEQETVSGTVSTTFAALYEEVKSISFDAIDLQVERITLADGKELAFSNDGKKLTVTLDRPYQHGEEFTVAVQYHAKPRRCQAMTVAGRTITKADFQSGQASRRPTQNSRSDQRTVGFGRVRW